MGSCLGCELPACFRADSGTTLIKQWAGECNRSIVWLGRFGWPVCESVSSVPAWFRADSGTNLIKQGENVTDRSCCLVAQW